MGSCQFPINSLFQNYPWEDGGTVERGMKKAAGFKCPLILITQVTLVKLLSYLRPLFPHL